MYRRVHVRGLINRNRAPEDCFAGVRAPEGSSVPDLHEVVRQSEVAAVQARVRARVRAGQSTTTHGATCEAGELGKAQRTAAWLGCWVICRWEDLGWGIGLSGRVSLTLQVVGGTRDGGVVSPTLALRTLFSCQTPRWVEGGRHPMPRASAAVDMCVQPGVQRVKDCRAERAAGNGLHLGAKRRSEHCETVLCILSSSMRSLRRNNALLDWMG